MKHDNFLKNSSISESLMLYQIKLFSLSLFLCFTAVICFFDIPLLFEFFQQRKMYQVNQQIAQEKNNLFLKLNTIEKNKNQKNEHVKNICNDLYLSLIDYCIKNKKIKVQNIKKDQQKIYLEVTTNNITDMNESIATIESIIKIPIKIEALELNDLLHVHLAATHTKKKK